MIGGELIHASRLPILNPPLSLQFTTCESNPLVSKGMVQITYTKAEKKKQFICHKGYIPCPEKKFKKRK